MARAIEEYVDSLYQKGKTQAEQSRQQRLQSDRQFIDQVNDSIDRMTQAAVKPYETQIQSLPNTYSKLYDANAVQELIGRRQLQETMANMGLTDSGLSRTQQTALTLQRGNADRDTRLQQQQKTQELQDQIAQIIENSAAQKQQQEATVRKNSNDSYNNLLDAAYNNAISLGAQLHSAELNRDFTREGWAREDKQAELERENALKVAEQEALTAAANKAIAELDAVEKAKRQKAQQEFDNQMAMVSTLEKAGASPDAILAYLQSVGLIPTSTGSDASSPEPSVTSPTTNTSTQSEPGVIYPQPVSYPIIGAIPQPHGEYLAAEIASGRMDKYAAVNDIISQFANDNDKIMAAKAAGVYDELMTRYR